MKAELRGFAGVAKTLFIPLRARIYVSRRFPEYFCDRAALELAPCLPPAEGERASEYAQLASAARSYCMDRQVGAFLSQHARCNIIYLGAGLESAYTRLAQESAFGPGARFYALDLPEVIEARRRVLGVGTQERLLGGDMFAPDWLSALDGSLPSLLIAAGVFQYFHAAQVEDFIRGLKAHFSAAQLLFDATNRKGLQFANRFVRRSGSGDARMYFYVDDAARFAAALDCELLELRGFFKEALAVLGRRLSLLSRVAMRVADGKRRCQIIRLRLSAGGQNVTQGRGAVGAGSGA